LTPEGLNREIRKWDLVALLVNVTVGAGILRLPSDVQRTVGNYSLAAFAVCAVIIALIALCFAEVGSRFSGTSEPPTTPPLFSHTFRCKARPKCSHPPGTRG